ncbi:MAG: hypothetical protein WCB67_05775 [Solirubrobacteraceae bacterium]
MSEPSNIAQSTDESTVRAGVRGTSARARTHSRGDDSSPYAHRFRTATAVLVGLAIGAIVIAVAVAVSAGGRTAGKSAPWSSWSPPDSGTAAALDIAGHVAPLYRISAVDQLSVVTVVDLESAAASAAQAAAAANGTPPPPSSGLQIAVHPSAVSSTISLLPGNTVAYNLCGVGGANCAIGVGTPSTARLLLLRREALELALYTFRYIHSVDNVVAILPPGHSTQTSFLTKTLPTSRTSSKPVNMAVLFGRQELAPLLNVPLSATLPEQFPPTVGAMTSAPEAGLVDQATANGLFTEHVQQAQDGSSLIVLDPLPPQ